MSVRQGSNVIAGGIPIDNTPTSGSSNAVSSGGVYTELAGKANVDLSNMNASQTAKNTIIGWGMPDYSSAVSQSWNTDYTATEDCLIYIRGRGGTTMNFTIGGTTYMINNNSYQIGIFIPIPKGQTYKASGSNGDQELIKFPLKGAA